MDALSAFLIRHVEPSNNERRRETCIPPIQIPAVLWSPSLRELADSDPPPIFLVLPPFDFVHICIFRRDLIPSTSVFRHDKICLYLYPAAIWFRLHLYSAAIRFVYTCIPPRFDSVYILYSAAIWFVYICIPPRFDSVYICIPPRFNFVYIYIPPRFDSVHSFLLAAKI